MRQSTTPVRRMALTALAACALAVAACSGTAPAEDPPSPTPTASPTEDPEQEESDETEQSLLTAESRLPEATTVIEGDTPAEIAAQTATTFFTYAPVVVVAVPGSTSAGDLARELGLPALLTAEPSEEPDEDGEDGEDSAPNPDGEEPAEPEDEAEESAGAQSSAVPTQQASASTGQHRALRAENADPGDEDEDDAEGDPDSESTDDEGAEEAPELTPEEQALLGALEELGTEVVLLLGEAELPEEAEVEVVTDVSSLPQTAPALRDARDALVLTTGGHGYGAAQATAQAAGAQILEVPGGHPGETSDLVAEIADRNPAVVVALGSAFGDEETLRWRIDAAATGVNLPGGGQLIAPDKTYVALYGSPGSSALGILGQQGIEDTIALAEQYAADYAPLTENTVVPTMEIITSIATADPGDGGMYTRALAIDQIRPLVDAAGENDQYVVLDLQPGRLDFLTQARMYEELLLEPHVGLALDPEWRLEDDQVHLAQIGSVDAAEINEVVDYLADLTQENHLPQKMLILHAFRNSMIPDVQDVDLSRPELAVVLHADGQGPPSAKHTTWRTLREHASNIEWWGWKNFIDEDEPMLTPEETIDQVDPEPMFISYQ